MNSDDNIQNDSVVDAFGGSVTDYDRLMNEFGIRPIDEVLGLLPKSKRHYYMNRNIMFGHTSLEPVIESINKKKPFAIMTGIKPSSAEYHIGNLITCNEVIYFQKLGGKVYFCIADIESYADGRLPLDQAEQNAIENVADLIALGLNLDKAYVYRQSHQMDVMRLGYLLSSHATHNMMKSIYGEHRLGVYNAAFIQVADILLPQLHNGPLPTVTPIGADQAPHARLSHDFVRKKFFQDTYKFMLPGFTFHKLIQGLDGSDKMAKRNPMSVLTLFESNKSLKKKIMNAFTGGRTTVEEQRELGGQPKICRIFDLYRYFFQSDEKKLKEIEGSCRKGELLCGEDKKNLLGIIQEFMQAHEKKRQDALPKAREVVLERLDG
ncbi:tryptophan--tRNA ligase [Candidatus Heimdallarchaeota archaeon B3_Heim]|nr:MAG: tryptophan--tRNA ligase [Candidatus Heimdallarchaeota archaeon B3_Heim]